MPNLPKRMRRDAAERRETILLAAEIAFAEHGFDVPLEEVCRLSGVGRATLYRNFENRLALVIAIMERNVDKLDALTEVVQDDPEGLFAYLEEVLNQQVLTGAQVYLLKQDVEVNERLKARVFCSLDLLLSNAQRAGLARPEITQWDMEVILGMMWGGLENRALADRQALAPFVMSFCRAGLRPAE